MIDPAVQGPPATTGRRILRILLVGCVWLSAGLSIGHAQDAPAKTEKSEKAATEEKPGAEEAGEMPADPALPKRPSALGEIFRRMLGGEPRPPRHSSSEPDSEADSSGTLDPIDSRAAREVRTENLLRLAEASARRGEHRLAIDCLQRLLDEPGDSLHRTKDRQWSSLRRAAQDQVRLLPREARQLYLEQYDGVARRALNEALQAGDAEAVARLADRYLHTAAGYEAANWLGALHTDRGEFGLADRWYRELARAEAPVTKNATWRWKAAFVARQAGRSADEAPWPTEFPAGGAKARYARLKDLQLPPDRALVPQSDWRQAYGSERRQGVAAAGDPLLISRWQNPLTDSPAVSRRIENLQLDLRDQGLSPVPAWQPIATQGLVVFRGLRGVRAVELATGQTLWETETSMTPERMIAGLPPDGVDPLQAWRFRMNNLQQDSEYSGPSSEHHPVATLLYRDGVYGSISSDGRHVFLLEDHAVLSRSQPGWQWGEQEQQDLYGLDWSTNRLSAYDLASGRLRWTVGGPAADDSMQLPLSDVCFLGAPAVDGDELFVMGVRKDEVRLWCLETISGRLLWSQLVCYQDSRIDKDIGRRWLVVQPSVAEGIIVCPTALGWLVAVDRLRHSVLWARRYAEPDASLNTENGGTLVPQRGLDAAWGPSAPVIAGRSVVYTAPEGPQLICCDLFDGTLKWQHLQQDGLYLAGVFDERVIVVGRASVVARKLSDGKVKWGYSYGPHTAAAADDDEEAETHALELQGRAGSPSAGPSGRGLATETEYYLPLANGELRVIRLSDGQLVRTLSVGPHAQALGNLVWHQDTLVSLASSGVAGFELRSGMLAEIAGRLQNNPQDAWALLREGEIHAMNGDSVAAWQQLQQVQPEKLAVADRSRWQRLSVQSLEDLIRRQPEAGAAWLADLRKLAVTDADRAVVAELEIARLEAEDQAAAAFERAWSAALDEQSQEPRVRPDDRRIKVAPAAWYRGRLEDLWRKAPAEEQAEIDRSITGILAKLTELPPAERLRQSQLLAFHPALVERQLRESRAVSSGADLVAVERELLPLADGPNASVAANALAELARRLQLAGRAADAGQLARRLEGAFGKEVLSDGKTGAEVAAELLKVPSGETPVIAEETSIAALQVQQGAVDFTTPEQELATDPGLPALQALDLVVQLGEQRLVVAERRTGQRLWTAPLRSSPHEQGDGYVASAFSGSTLYLVHHGILHAIAPLERTVLWTRPISDEGGDNGHWRAAEREPPPPLVSVDDLHGYNSPVLARAMRGGSLAAVTSRYVAVSSRRTLRVLDASTGDELWQYQGLSPEDAVVGFDSQLVILSLDGDVRIVLRATDGQPLQANEATNLVGQSLAVRGDCVLVADWQDKKSLLSLFGAKEGQTRLRLVDVTTGVERWKRELKGTQALVGMVSPTEVFVAQGTKSVQVIDAATGVPRPLEAVPNARVGSPADAHVLLDDERIYLLANSNDGRRYEHYAETVPSVEMHGSVACWERATGKLLWTKDVRRQHLVVERFRSSPSLLFVARSWVAKEEINYTLLDLLALDKRTGTELHASNLPTMFSGFHSLKILPRDRALELRSYNYRIRLTPAPATPAGQAATTPAPPAAAKD